MSLVTQRERRKNAGSKMAKLLDEEEEDDFYKTAYGGFNEVFFTVHFLQICEKINYLQFICFV